MGNQLTGIAPSQILPVEHYLTDNANYKFDTSLGSTRFFKVARASNQEGPVVVKVFVIHDPSLPLNTYRDGIEDIKTKLLGVSNCIPFQKATLSDKAALLFRQYVKDSLYDRISTRPFLSHIEKKWLAFQLLCALNQCHKRGVCHGDIKSENVMVTSWNWLLLTDFASFKPTYLPEDNPADFSYFFDTSRRRTCYIAPERFVEGAWRTSETGREAANLDITANEVKKGDLTSAMDVFSAGCVIAELFTEGCAPFDLSQLLAYRAGEYSPSKVIDKIEDPDIKELLKHMLQKNTTSRLSAEDYLCQQKDKAFPTSFYTFLKPYLQRFASTPIMPADDRIARIRRDLGLIIKNLEISESDPSQNSVLVLLITLVTSCLRCLRFLANKLMALEVMLKLSKYVSADIILDRLLPYMLYFVNDPFPRVRAETIATITHCLANVQEVPVSDTNIFPEYILPQMSPLSQDHAVIVRLAYSENIALLAETALRFLEIVQLNSSETGNDGSQEISQTKASTYDTELLALQSMIQQKVVTLLSDPDNIVKHTLLKAGITRLCVFFGRQKANDVLVSHMITFLNDKDDWQLRGAFFDSIVGVAAYVGWQSSDILKPLLQQGLTDSEEFVIHKTLSALISLTELGLLQKSILHEMLKDIVPFLCHPNTWIQQGAVGFVTAVAKMLSIADVHCNVLPLIEPYLKLPIIQVDQEVVLLSALKEPVSRTLYDYLLRIPTTNQLERLFDCLLDRKMMRNLCRAGHSPTYNEIADDLTITMRKLSSQGMISADEDKLLALRDFILKVHRTRAGSSDISSSSSEDLIRSGALNLATLGRNLVRRHADLHPTPDSKADPHQNQAARSSDLSKVLTSPNEDWKQMFGSGDTSDRSSSTTGSKKLKQPPQLVSSAMSNSSSSSNINPDESTSSHSSIMSPSTDTVTVSHSQIPPHIEGVSHRRSGSQGSSGAFGVGSLAWGSQSDRPIVQPRNAVCKAELHNLVLRKRQQYTDYQLNRDLLDHTTWENRPPPPSWKPRGQLVAHLHEHKGAVNRIQVSQESADHSYFATCSNDGTVKLWDCARMEGRNVTNRSRHTYNKQGGQLKALTFCDNSQSIASASDAGSIHVFRMEQGSTRISILHTKQLDVEAEGLPVDMTCFDTGSQNVITYATVHGYLVGWDLRSQQVAWTLKNDPKLGLITSFAVQPQLNWLAVGTSSGAHICWDMRFQLPITTIHHPTGARVRRLLVYHAEASSIISSVQGNNEVSFWDLETAARQRTLWASSTPALSRTQASAHSCNALHLGMTDSNMFLLTAGSDMRVRYWDLTSPDNSRIVVSAANDPSQQLSVSYRSRIIEGTNVLQETYSKPSSTTRPGSAGEDTPRRGPDSPPCGHHDTITDVNICQTTQCFLLTCSRDGVVKVWK